MGSSEERAHPLGDHLATVEPAPAPRRSTWLDVAEPCSLYCIRFVLCLFTAFGLKVARSFVAILALYYTLLRADVRQASRAYLARMKLPTRFRDVYAHVRCFADVAVDRLF